MKPDPDDEDLRLVSSGDEGAATRLYDRYATRIHRLAYLVLRDNQAAEDVMQDTFLRLWRHAPRWREGTPLLPWLLRVASNLSTDQIRKRGRLIIGDPPDRVDPSTSGYRATLERQIGEHVAAAMATLPKRQRAALQLTWQGDLSNAEAGRALGVSEQAIESLVARARRNLRKKLAPFKTDIIGDDDVEN